LSLSLSLSYNDSWRLVSELTVISISPCGTLSFQLVQDPGLDNINTVHTFRRCESIQQNKADSYSTDIVNTCSSYPQSPTRPLPLAQSLRSPIHIASYARPDLHLFPTLHRIKQNPYPFLELQLLKIKIRLRFRGNHFRLSRLSPHKNHGYRIAHLII
jgi:hypothetical protein